MIFDVVIGTCWVVCGECYLCNQLHCNVRRNTGWDRWFKFVLILNDDEEDNILRFFFFSLVMKFFNFFRFGYEDEVFSRFEDERGK